MTRYIGIIGYPLKHSISPAFQQAALDHYRLDVRYKAWETEPEQLGVVVERLRHPDYLGANVTIPYKEKVLSLMDGLDGFSARIGAVNTIVNRDGRLLGHNTDAEGFLRALREEGHFEPKGKGVMLLGSGGVARAAAFALAEVGVSSLVVVNRTMSRAEALAAALEGSLKQGQPVVTLPWGSPELALWLSGCQLLVNCTSVGMRHSRLEGESPLEANLIPQDILVYDLVYNPMETPLLAVARERGARTLGGLPMLVYQGAASFELWTGREALFSLMFQAARGVLERS